MFDINNPVLATDVHVIGYAFTFNGTQPDKSNSSTLAATNQNSTLQPEVLANFPVTGESTRTGVSDRVLFADATLSDSASQSGSKWTGVNFTAVDGGFQWAGQNPYPHTSPHLSKAVPSGGDVGFKDGHVEWRKFSDMTPRTITGKVFWW